MFINGEADKQIWYIHKMEYYLAMKKGQKTDTCFTVDEPGEYYAKGKKPDTKDYICVYI